jgi:hypothetical protein
VGWLSFFLYIIKKQIMPLYGEYGYKTLLSEKDFLKVQYRARNLPSGSHIKEILYQDKELLFKTESATTRGKIWTQKLIVKDLSVLAEGLSPMALQNLIRESALEIHCDCPAFLYWGYQYKAWTRGYGIEVETRFPKIRNPKLQGYVCKHLYNVMEIYPFLQAKIVSVMRKQFPLMDDSILTNILM